MLSPNLFFALLLSLALWAPSAVAQSADAPSLTFRSELWQREYRQQQKKRDVEEGLVDPDSSSISKNAPQIGVPSSVQGDDVVYLSNRLTIPGEARLEDLREETPIAEWQVDRQLVLEATSGTFRDSPSEWQLSQAPAASGPAAELSKGPTMTTYLVGFMACIVVGGALMTGRET